MGAMQAVRPGRAFMGRLPHGADLLEAITELCRAEEIRCGQVSALGAVQRARLGYYDQGTRQYHFHEVLKPLEIASLVGNISLKDGAVMVHAHVTLADERGHAFGGHLGEGTTIFACECFVREWTGAEFHRAHDDRTGLPLWSMQE